jgi:phosphatidylglycerophosphate synthase
MSQQGRKIPENYENFIDNYIIELGIKLNPYFKKLNLTPNHLTAISAIFGLLSVYSIYNDKFILAGILYFISYAFDCFDGNYARMYGMVSEFGDLFDHIKDISVIILLYLVIWFKPNIKKKKKVIFTAISVLLMMTTSIHLGCQERYYSRNEKSGESNALNFTKKVSKGICSKSNNYDNLRFTKWGGCGTYNLMLVLMIPFLKG